jgi:hypothetical protein
MCKNLWLIVLAAVAIPMVAAAKMPDAPPAGWTLAPQTPASEPLFQSRVRPRPGPYRPGPYRQRTYRSPMSAIPFTAEIHLGFFDPIDNFSTGFAGGFRVGPQVDPHIQFGLAMDWWHRSDDKVMDLGRVEVPVGTASEKLILSESAANLIPILMFVQVGGDENMSVVPYGGIGFGYEWLFLSANDYLTDESFDQTFGGFGWQAWVGAGLPLDYNMRVNAEVFFNGCEVGSDVDVDIEGYGPATVRDIIKMNGVGIRFGVAWQF